MADLPVSAKKKLDSTKRSSAKKSPLPPRVQCWMKVLLLVDRLSAFFLQAPRTQGLPPQHWTTGARGAVKFSAVKLTSFFFADTGVKSFAKRELRIHRSPSSMRLSVDSCLAVASQRVDTKRRECWKYIEWRMNWEHDSREHGQAISGSWCVAWIPS